MKIGKLASFAKRVLNEGIDIQQFQLLSDDGLFQWACKTFNSRIKSDRELRKETNLLNLDVYKEDLEGFVKAVGKAVDLIQKRQVEKIVRKARNTKGVNFVYEDEKCFITSPESYAYSRAAAYLDGGTANWCIATPKDEAGDFWDRYDAEAVFYIYQKGMNSWVMLMNPYDVYKTSRGIGSFSEFETRSNNIGEKTDLRKEAFGKMLESIGMDDIHFFVTLAKNLKERKFWETYDYFNPRDASKLLIYASAENDLDTVKYLVEGDMAMVEWRDGRGRTAITEAIQKKNTEIVKFLIQNGVDPNGEVDGTTVWSYAWGHGLGRDVYDVMYEKGIDFDDPKNNRSVTQAMRRGDVEGLKWLFGIGANLDDIPFQDYDFVLWNLLRYKAREVVHGILDVLVENGYYDDVTFKYAIKGGFQDIVEKILKIVPSIKNLSVQEGEHKVTPLQVAIREGRYGIALKLVELGADVTKADEYGVTALQDCFEVYRGDQKELLELAKTLRAKGSPVIDAALSSLQAKCLREGRGGLERAQMIRSCGLPLIADSKVKCDFVQCCKSYGRLEIIKLFLDWGMPVNYKMPESPFGAALISGQLEYLEPLLEHGADVNFDEYVIKATRSGSKRLLKVILGMGADVNQKGQEGATALHYAVYDDEEELVKMLVAAGADMDEKTPDGRSVFDLARFDDMKFLLKELKAKESS